MGTSSVPQHPQLQNTGSAPLSKTLPPMHTSMADMTHSLSKSRGSHTTTSILHPQLPTHIFTDNMVPLYLLINYQNFLLTHRHHPNSHLLAIFVNRIMGHCHLVHLIKVRPQLRIMVNEKTNKLVKELWNVKQKTHRSHVEGSSHNYHGGWSKRR